MLFLIQKDEFSTPNQLYMPPQCCGRGPLLLNPAFPALNSPDYYSIFFLIIISHLTFVKTFRGFTEFNGLASYIQVPRSLDL